MFAVFREVLGSPGTAFLLARDRHPGADALASALERATDDDEPVLLAGAALAFHHALAGSDRSWCLPPSSRAMVTGGFKGLRASADPVGLARVIEEKLGIPPELQATEYGMTELSTQYYDAKLRRALGFDDSARGLVIPPWARVRIVEPGEAHESPPGETGAILHYDLANRGSALAIQTSDLGARTRADAFELRGREPGAEARGCSLAADLWLGGA
jgi:hypothetical protein